MATYSPNLGLTLLANGEGNGTWGQTTNTNLGTLLEQAISGYVVFPMPDSDTTITIPNGASGTARNMYIECQGVLSAARSLIVPSNPKLYYIYNNTTGGFNLTVKVSGQTGITIPAGSKAALVCNGFDIFAADNFYTNVDINGGFVDNTPIGSVTPSTGKFTTVNINPGVGGAALVVSSVANNTNTIQLPTAGSMINFARSSDGSGTLFVGSRSGSGSISLYNTGGTSAQVEVDGGVVRIYTNGNQRIVTASAGGTTFNAPDSGTNVTINALNGQFGLNVVAGTSVNAANFDATAANVAPIKVTLSSAIARVIETSTGASTGAAAANITSGTILSANKPGGANTVFHWMTVNINGTTGYIPVWGA